MIAKRDCCCSSVVEVGSTGTNDVQPGKWHRPFSVSEERRERQKQIDFRLVEARGRGANFVHPAERDFSLSSLLTSVVQIT